ncbi:transcriptional regulator domain-containing protein [Sphingopyxis sp. FD7]|uniref:transcriptional regulator domain-containing protein n=1 Tax=Sphingopyxis sp. FD7 TaxID=1914525 RepID=UPI001E291E53|nr:DUF6499 domain-containing protein [Sphingopyxis sp. FD7]
MSGGSSWRSPSTADQYRHHDYADFAQEFLNRNPAYRADHAETLARIVQSPETTIDEQEGLARRWGLCFPHRSSWTPAKTPRVWGHDLIHSVHWTERFDALTQPVFAGGAPGAAEQGRRPAGGFGGHGGVRAFPAAVDQGPRL